MEERGKKNANGNRQEERATEPRTIKIRTDTQKTHSKLNVVHSYKEQPLKGGPPQLNIKIKKKHYYRHVYRIT